MKVHIDTKYAMTVHRRILKKRRIVYLLVGKRTFKYKGGKSRIAYIGTSKRGASRIASSAAHRAEEMFAKWGSKEMQVYIATCDAVPGLQSWKYLERALLAQFLSYYLQLPFCNKQGRKYKYDEKLQKMFKQQRIYKIVKSFGAVR